MLQATSEDRRYCPNCHYPIAKGGRFCSECGQKYTTGRVAVWELVSDLLDSVLNIDSKIFRTLGTLFIPGKLTVQYFKGHHQRYVPPLRLFFVLAVIFFTVFGIMLNRSVAPFMQRMEDSQQGDAYMAVFMEELDSVRQTVEPEFSAPEVPAAFDSLEIRLHGSREDSLSTGYLDFSSSATIEAKELMVAKRDLIGLTPEELCDRYGVAGFVNRLQFKQFLKVYQEGGSFTQFALSNALWMVLLMMPALALILKLLYIRRGQYYVEHLVFSFHYHAFTFLLISVGIVLGSDFMFTVNDNKIEGGVFDGNLVSGITYLLVYLYLFLAMRRVYKQGFFKTFVKFSILNFAYTLIFVLFLSVFAVITALTF